ncbi:MAG: GNAT family N-acetyltransferase [Candidatus Dadabacteria bacterium]|nr:GNAT family N-acetyltransferase [Candidatus Dadabacteria bacterium]
MSESENPVSRRPGFTPPSGLAPPEITIRRYRPEDAEAISDLYRKSVTEIGIERYSPAEVEAWASYADEVEELRHRLAEGLTLIAESGGRMAAFGQLKPANRVEFLYTLKDFSRMGIATLLYGRLEEAAIASGSRVLHTDASRISRPLFEKMGFFLVEAVVEERKGVKLECFVMRKELPR